MLSRQRHGRWTAPRLFVSSSLTERETVDRFQGELRDLARSLSPGGLLSGLGGVGGMYKEIWTKARAVIESRDVVLAREVGPKLRAHPDQRRRSLILRQLVMPQFQKVEQLAIRASLFTNDTAAITTLDKVRDIAEESNHLFTASKTDPETERNKLATQVGETFEELATLTRRLSTALTVIAPDEPRAAASRAE